MSSFPMVLHNCGEKINLISNAESYLFCKIPLIDMGVGILHWQWQCKTNDY